MKLILNMWGLFHFLFTSISLMSMGLGLCGEFTESSFDVSNLWFLATKDCIKNGFFRNVVINLVDVRAIFFSLEGNRFLND